MSKRTSVPPPEILVKPEFSQMPIVSSSSQKISTVLTNVQRRNVQTFAPQVQRDLTIYQMAAQGELVMLMNKIKSMTSSIDAQDPQGFSAFLWACANGQKAAVELLLYCGANCYLSGDNGENGLILAAYRGHHDVVVYLLKAGLDVNLSDELCNTALMFAAYSNHAGIVSLLLDWGADFTMENADGWTALDFAINKNSAASQKVIEKHMAQLLQGK